MNRRTKIARRAQAKMRRKLHRNAGNTKYTPHQNGGEYVETPGSIRSVASNSPIDYGIAALIAAMARPYGRRRP